MYSKIERLLNEKGISAYRMCKDTGISRSLVSQWKSGQDAALSRLNQNRLDSR